ncbi:hypothetical protein M3J09_000536 [Ascochyta lentis]
MWCFPLTWAVLLAAGLAHGTCFLTFYATCSTRETEQSEIYPSLGSGARKWKSNRMCCYEDGGQLRRFEATAIFDHVL